MKISEKIYQLRKKYNMSQEELANKLDVSRQTVSKWETGESCPDFDKIVPLCEIFEISTEELLRDKKLSMNEKETNVDIPKAIMICIAIFLYFLSLMSLMITEEVFNLNDGISVAVFFLICGIATVLIIYAVMTRPSKSKSITEDKIYNEPILKSVLGITSLIFTCIYLLISFITMAWHITWIIWIVYSIVVEIIKLIFRLKEIEKDEK